MNLPTQARYVVFSLIGVLLAVVLGWGPASPAHATTDQTPSWLTDVALGAGTAPTAVAVTPNGSSAYVTNSGTNTVSVLNTATNSIDASITLPSGSAPSSVAITPNGAHAYVTNSGINTVSVLNTATNSIDASITLPSGSAPSSVAITPNGAHAYVTNSGNSTVNVIDTATHVIDATIALPAGAAPNTIAFTPSGNRAYVTNGGSNTVSVVDTDASSPNFNTITATITGLSSPQGIAITPDGTRAYVTNSGNGTVSVINTSSNTITDTVTLPPASNPDPRGVVVSTDGSSVYVADQSTVWTIETATNTRDNGTGLDAGGLRGIAVNPNGSRIYGAASTGNALAVLGTGTRVPCTYPYAWSGGAGTLADPYRVTSQSDLDAVSYCLSSAFLQTQDIALTGPWTPIGTTAAPFTGTYDGDGNTITGLVLNDSSVPSGEPAGLFGRAVGADFSDLNINDGQAAVARDNAGLLVGSCEYCQNDSIDVTGSVTATGDNVGGLAGASLGSSVSLSSSAVTVQGHRITGGLIGIITDGTVSDSCSTGSVIGTSGVGGLAGSTGTNAVLTLTCATGDVIGDLYVGGLVGILGAPDAPTPGNFATIHRSFATGDVTATHGSTAFAGGLVGMNWKSGGDDYVITDTFASGSVTGAANVGGLLGGVTSTEAIAYRSYASGSVNGPANQSTGGFLGTATSGLPPGKYVSDYWNIDTSGRTFGVGGEGFNTTGVNVSMITGLTSQQMGSSSNFAGWDFSTVWGYDCQLSPFPLLRWKFPTATATTCFGSSPTPQATSTTHTSTTSATPSAESTPSPSPPVSGATHLAPGRARATIDGTPVRVRTTKRERGNGIVVSVEQMRFTLRSTTPRGQRVPTAPNGALVVARAGTMPVTGNGLASGSQITTTLYSDPIPLGTTTTHTKGGYSTQPKIPATVPTGTHTLQLKGLTKSGAPFALDLGVTVATPVVALGAHPVITVSPRTAVPGDPLTIKATDVQPRCIVDFSLGTNSTRAHVSTSGHALASLVVPARGPQLKTWVHGKGCGDIHLVQDLRQTR